MKVNFPSSKKVYLNLQLGARLGCESFLWLDMTHVYLENPDAVVKIDYSNVLPVMKSQMFLVFTTRPFS